LALIHVIFDLKSIIAPIMNHMNENARLTIRRITSNIAIMEVIMPIV